ncbi:DUF1361 domain-containing protein [Pantanalinema rosaneae CENA516]|uniref:DUF1361 domain-containing protein n=1 Tax=Pantanalinema rosaneae TaxID=1620701 RepID=UPI003D6E5714
MTWHTLIWDTFFANSDWMVWNLFLALLPLGLSVWLFRQAKTRSVVWWVVALVFVAFLPNAPYVLTDLIHLVRELQQTSSLFVGTLLIIPKYLVFVLVGLMAYVLSLINLGYYLQRQGLGRYVFQAELLLHALSAIGVYLGRFERFNSWNLVTHPHHVAVSLVENLLDHRPLFLIMLGFIGFTGLYWVFKEITLALLLQRRYIKTLRQLSVRLEED